LKNSEVDLTGSLVINAFSGNQSLDEEIIAVSAAIGAAPQGMAAAVAISINEIDNQTVAYASGNVGAGVQLDGNGSVKAEDNADIVSVAGALGAGQKAGVGASVTLNSIHSEVGSYLSDIVVSAPTGSLAVDGKTSAAITTIAIAGGVSNRLGVGGSVALNDIGNQTNTFIGNNANVTARDAVAVRSEDKSKIFALTGGLAGAAGTAAIGASVSTNEIQNHVKAWIDNSSVQSTTSSVGVTADSNPSILAISVGGALANSAALAGSVSLNEINNTVEAKITGGADVDASGDVQVSAQDSATLLVIAGAVAGASSGAIGASVATTETTNTISAYIEASNVDSANGSVNVTAGFSPPDVNPVLSSVAVDGDTVALPDRGDSQVTSITIAGAGASSFAGGGSVSLNWLQNTVEARIGNSAVVHADSGAVNVLATDDATINSLAGTLVGAGSASIGASVSYNYIGGDPNDSANSDQNVVRATIEDATVTANAVNVSATADAEINNLTAAGAGAGTFALGGAVSMNLIRRNVDANISAGASVTTDTSHVDVFAGDTSSIETIAGQASLAGTVSAGAAVGYNEIDNDIQASISNATVTSTAAAGDVLVRSDSDVDVTAIAAGLAIAGKAGIAGSVAVNVINTDTSSSIEGSSIQSARDAKVDANSNVDGTLGVGSLGGGLILGASGSVVVGTFGGSTQAFVRGSDVTANRDILIDASSVEDVELIGATAAGGIVGVGGTVSVVSADSETRAFVDTLDPLGSPTTSSLDAGQDVKISAMNTAEYDNIAGTVAGGAAGLGASVDVITIKNSVDAHVGANSEVTAVRDVKVDADAVRDVSSNVIAFAGGGLGIAGAVSVISIGSGMDATSHGEASAANSALSANLDRGNELPFSSELQSLTLTVDPVVTGTVAYVGESATVVAGRDLYITADESVTLDALAGAAALGGGAAIGAGVNVTTLASSTRAYVKANATLSAVDEVKIDAGYVNNIDVLAAGGAAGGLIGLGAQVGIVTDKSVQSAYTEDAVNVVRAAELILHADANRDITAAGKGASVGGLAAGAAVAEVKVSGSTFAYLGTNNQIGTAGQTVHDVTITANSNLDAKADVLAVAAGIGAGQGNQARTEFTSNVRAYVLNGTVIDVLGDVTVSAVATPQMESNAFGISAGAAAVGVSTAFSHASPDTIATLGNPLNAAVGDIQVTANSVAISSSVANPASGYAAEADATGSVGGLIGANATVTEAKSNGTATAFVAEDSVLYVTNGVAINASGNSKQFASSDSYAVGLYAAGGNDAEAISTVTTLSFLSTDVTVKNGEDVGGLTDGEIYYVVIDDQRPFARSAVDAANNTINLGTDHGLQTGDEVVYLYESVVNQPLTG
ncbi:MAG: hypothetical protein KDA87_06875, partial [Planctomycetales bacterium]|nr:hypothetical protein [Planctomycetales bacterium]